MYRQRIVLLKCTWKHFAEHLWKKSNRETIYHKIQCFRECVMDEVQLLYCCYFFKYMWVYLNDYGWKKVKYEEWHLKKKLAFLCWCCLWSLWIGLLLFFLDIYLMEHNNTFLRNKCFNLNLLNTFHLKTGTYKYPSVNLVKSEGLSDEQDRVKVSPSSHTQMYN